MSKQLATVGRKSSLLPGRNLQSEEPDSEEG